MERSTILTEGNVINDMALRIDSATDHQDNKLNSIKTIEEMERAHIIVILEQCNYRVSGPGGAAELLNLPPSTLSSKIKKLGIK